MLTHCIIVLIRTYITHTSDELPYMAKHSRGKFSWIFSFTAKVFPCLFCMLVVFIHYSDEMMAHIRSCSTKLFHQKVLFLVTTKVFSLECFCLMRYIIPYHIHYRGLSRGVSEVEGIVSSDTGDSE